MGKHRARGCHSFSPTDWELPESSEERGGAHRSPETTSPDGKSRRNKVVAAMLAAGTVTAVGLPITAATATQDDGKSTKLAGQSQGQNSLSAALTGTEQSPASVEILPPDMASDSVAEAQQLDKSAAIEQARIAREEAERQAREEAERQAREAAERARQQAAAEAAAEQAAAAEQQSQTTSASSSSSSGYYKPAEGTYTSGFGYRSGSSHNGIDIANSIGTPIRAVSSGQVISAGQASGFGNWVRIQHDDGTITVYGHISSWNVSVGERVEGGQQIAKMGNEGQSSGPHLHFEVRPGGGSPVDPVGWLQERGISVQ